MSTKKVDTRQVTQAILKVFQNQVVNWLTVSDWSSFR